MIEFRRLSTGPTLSEVIRAAAEAQASAWNRMMPLAVWCRPATFLMLRQQEPSRPVSGLIHPSQVSSSPPRRTRRMGQASLVKGCFLAASLVLTTTRLLLRAALLSSEEAGRSLRWSSRLTRTGMRLWRKGQPYL